MKKPLKIVLADLTYYNKLALLNIYTPQNIGFIASYINKKFGSEIQTLIFKNAEEFLTSVRSEKPDVIGLSLYFWNTSLNALIIKRIRALYGNDVAIILGGPSIDVDVQEQRKMFERFPGINAIIPNEGEIGFSNIVEAKLRGDLFENPLAGVSFMREGTFVMGQAVGLSTDLTLIESPYLNGLLDPYVTTFYQPLLQTSRLCPYTCAFCVSGKNKGKLRAFPIEQIKEELTFLAKKFVDRPHLTMYLSDENFGILKRDIEIAEHILRCSKDLGWPKQLFFYNDKRFTQTSREVLQILGTLTQNGMTLALQTENRETLKAVNRTNITDEQIVDAIKWASDQDLLSTTELIFGLPYETKDSFIQLLEKSVERGFDSVLCNTLFIMDGIEMNRDIYRKEHQLTTRFRILGTNYGMTDGEFTAEHEEIVVSSSHFTFDEFISIRCLNMLFYSVYTYNIYKWFFNYVRHIQVSLVKLFDSLMNPPDDRPWRQDYLDFVREVKATFVNEIVDTKEGVREEALRIFKKNGNDVGEPDRLNVYFASRLAYSEQKWLGEVLKQHLELFLNFKEKPEIETTIDMLLEICRKEWINLRMDKPHEQLSDQAFPYDLNAWKRKKFKTPLMDFKVDGEKFSYKLNERSKEQIQAYRKNFSYMADRDFYYNAFNFVQPRTLLKYDIEYKFKPF